MENKIVLAYSGGLDTSVAIRWLHEKYEAEIVTVVVDVGAEKELKMIKDKALKIGAVKSLVVDAKEEFVGEYVFPALKANALYESRYPLATALARPLISKILVDIAHQEGASMVAHGSTGKGNDQVRFDVSVAALDPSLRIIAPARDWDLNREKEIEYAREHGIPIPIDLDKPYSIDQNLWGRAIECGALEDLNAEPPEDVFEWTRNPDEAPGAPQYVEIEFERGIPVAVDGTRMDPVSLITHLNEMGGKHGVGRIDHVENRLVGIKSREVYECPAATILLEAHRDLERLVSPRELIWFKDTVDLRFNQAVYDGLWFSPLRAALQAFVETAQERVWGKIRMKLSRGRCWVVGRSSPYSLYRKDLATYSKEDAFDHQAAVGFIKIYELPTKTYAMLSKKQESELAGRARK